MLERIMDKLIVKGARENNLKNIDVELPRDKLIVVSGLSGSGKSSLAFDTIFAEGQRRYVESLSTYARVITSYSIHYTKLYEGIRSDGSPSTRSFSMKA